MQNFKRKILCALTLLLFAVGATPVAQRTAADLVAINHNGLVIEVSSIAAAFHLMFHEGDTLVEDPCIPNPNCGR